MFIDNINPMGFCPLPGLFKKKTGRRGSAGKNKLNARESLLYSPLKEGKALKVSLPPVLVANAQILQPEGFWVTASCPLFPPGSRRRPIGVLDKVQGILDPLIHLLQGDKLRSPDLA